MNKEFIEIYNKVSNEKYNIENENNFNKVIKHTEKNKFNNAWKYYYNLAESYYEYNGDLNIPQSFKTTNGYEYDEQGFMLGRWLNRQVLAYQNKDNFKLTEEQIKLLEKIKIVWFDENTDQKLQSEIINEQNKNKKKIEILNRVRSYLNTLDENRVYSKEEINLGFVKKLNK